MENFTYYNPTKLIFGKGQIDQLKKELKQYGKNVLLVYGGGSIKRNGLYDVIQAVSLNAAASVNKQHVFPVLLQLFFQLVDLTFSENQFRRIVVRKVLHLS